MTYKHIFLTRFNLQFESDTTIHVHPQWLDERFRLFEQYCLPSIIQQTNHNFKWIILASDDTPTIYQDRLLKYSQEYSFIDIIFCPYYNDINELYKSIGEKYAIGYDFLLSTRIDNDDMLSSYFVETLQSYLQDMQLRKCIITFPYGIQWFEEENMTFRVKYDKNHFLSFLEPSSCIKTSLGVNHPTVSTQDMTPIMTRDLWCEIVHHNNISNNYTPVYQYSLHKPNQQYPIILTRAKNWKQAIFLLTKHLTFRYRQIKHVIIRLFDSRTS